MTRMQQHGMPVSVLRGPDGATAVVADHGAHLLSWIPAGGEEALFLSALSRYGPGDAIRGGVPIIFPQFAERGTGKRHGFARNLPWRRSAMDESDGAAGDCAAARYVLTHDDIGSHAWPHLFALECDIRLGEGQLELSLAVHNPSDQCWEFSAALHTYLRVDPQATAVLAGLQGLSYIDQVRHGMTDVEAAATLMIDRELDRIYLDTPALLRIADGRRVIALRQSGFADTVVWNPGAEKGDALADLATGDYRSFVCIEAAAVSRPVLLEGGASWRGSQTLIIESAMA